QLMYGGGGRVYPTKLGRSLHLLRTQRPGNNDFGILKMLLDPVVAGQVNDFYPWEVFAKLFGNPCRSIPEFEAVVKNDEELHWMQEFNHRGHTEDTGNASE